MVRHLELKAGMSEFDDRVKIMCDSEVIKKCDIYREKSRFGMLSKLGLVCFCLLSLLLSCSEEDKYNENGGNDFHTISIGVDGDFSINISHKKEMRAANPSGSVVKMEELVLFTVDKKSRIILNATQMEEQTNNRYSCRIPSEIDLSVVGFYAVANVKANFGEFTRFENKPFDEFLDMTVKSTHDDNNIATSSSSALSYPLMNREAATYNSATGRISDISLSHLPARIYLDCERLGYPIKSVFLQNISRTTSLRTITEKEGNGKAEELFNWTDTIPGIASDGTNYYYLVYPSDREVSISITSAGKSPASASADLGILKPGYSYTLRMNYPVNISFDEIVTDGKITMAKGRTSEFEFKVANTAIVRTVELTSSDENVFKVVGGVEADWNKFTLESVGQGEATLTAKCMGTTISCTVVVVSDDTHFVTINGETVGSYAEGDSVTVCAPFKTSSKFSHWTTDIETILSATDYALNLHSPTLIFTMPASAVSFTAEYTEAPYMVTINKPGRIVNSRDGQFEAALVKETETGYIRYYATGDEVRISAPDTDTRFKAWVASDNTNSNIYFYINNNGGGGQKSTTWFKMMILSDAELTPTYKNAPYWSTRTTAKGHITANFIDRVNENSGELTIPGGTTFYRAYDLLEKEIIMRALNTVESTFANAPRRAVKITFAVYNRPGELIAGGTEPVLAYYAPPYDKPKAKWLASDFDGRAAGIVAASSKFEAVWRDQLNIVPDDADEDNRFVGSCDGFMVLNHSYIKNLYKGEDENGIGRTQADFESLIMHELGHIICYHSFNENANHTNGMHALDVFVAADTDPANKNVVNGTMDYGAQPLIYNEFVKSYHGRQYLHVLTGDFGHLFPGTIRGVGTHGVAMGRCYRKFADFELAFLSEMGWKINPNAWDNPPNLP